MKILAIGAHQDDNEFRCGGMAALWVAAGHEVRFLSMCNGCGGHHIMTPKETSERRARESASVAEYLGIRYDIWDVDDCTLMPTLEYRERLVRYIREYAPDLIISHRTIDYHALSLRLEALVQEQPTVLLETLAHKLATCCVQEFGAISATVELHKYILPQLASTAVRTTVCAQA